MTTSVQQKRPVPKDFCTTGQFAFDGGPLVLAGHEVWAVCENASCHHPRCGAEGSSRVFRVRSSRDLYRHLSPALKSVAGKRIMFLGPLVDPLAARGMEKVTKRISDLGGSVTGDVSSADVVVFAQGSRVDDAAFLANHIETPEREREALEEYAVAERIALEGGPSLVSHAELHACLFGSARVLVAPNGWLRGRPSAAQIRGDEGVARGRHLRRDAPAAGSPLEWPENGEDVFARGSTDYHQSRSFRSFSVSEEASRDMKEFCRDHPPRYVQASPSTPGVNLWTMPEQEALRNYRYMEADARLYGSYHVLKGAILLVRSQPDSSRTGAALAVSVTGRRLALREEIRGSRREFEDLSGKFAMLKGVRIVAGAHLRALRPSPGEAVGDRLHCAPAASDHAVVRAVSRVFGLSVTASDPTAEQFVMVEDALPGLIDELLSGAAFASGEEGQISLANDKVAELRSKSGLNSHGIGTTDVESTAGEYREKFVDAKEPQAWLVPSDTRAEDRPGMLRRLEAVATTTSDLLRYQNRQTDENSESLVRATANRLRAAKGLPPVVGVEKLPIYEATADGFVVNEVTVTAPHPKFPGLYLQISGTVGPAAPHPVTGRPSRTFTVRTIIALSRVDREGWGGGLAAEVAGLSAEERDRRAHRAAQKKGADREKKAAREEKIKARKAAQKAANEAKKQVEKKNR